MSLSSPQHITQLLIEWSSGNKAALDQLMVYIYDELRRLAHHYLINERNNHTLQTTALVHETYMRLARYRKTPCRERSHFFAITAQAMRRVLIEYARAYQREKRGGNTIRVSVDEEALASLANSLVIASDHSLDMIALDKALTDLEAKDPRASRVVEMRFFAGMSNEEIAEVLGVAPNTVMRDWRFAKVWLRNEILKAVSKDK
jgi:RNA polymerase sigma factor (TIGR02999 family)